MVQFQFSSLLLLYCLLPSRKKSIVQLFFYLASFLLPLALQFLPSAGNSWPFYSGWLLFIFKCQFKNYFHQGMSLILPLPLQSCVTILHYKVQLNNQLINHCCLSSIVHLLGGLFMKSRQWSVYWPYITTFHTALSVQFLIFLFSSAFILVKLP